MKNLIRAIAKLPGRRLRQLIKAGRLDAKVRALEDRLAAVRTVEARLERRLEAAVRKFAALVGGAVSRKRGPGRPRKHRGPGRPPGRRGPGRPPKAGGRRGRRRANEKPLALVLKDVLAKKGQAMAVADLAAEARAGGYQTKSKPAVFAITVSLALRKNTALFARVGRKYQLAKGAEATG